MNNNIGQSSKRNQKLKLYFTLLLLSICCIIIGSSLSMSSCVTATAGTKYEVYYTLYDTGQHVISGEHYINVVTFGKTPDVVYTNYLDVLNFKKSHQIDRSDPNYQWDGFIGDRPHIDETSIYKHPVIVKISEIMAGSGLITSILLMAIIVCTFSDKYYQKKEN